LTPDPPASTSAEENRQPDDQAAWAAHSSHGASAPLQLATEETDRGDVVLDLTAPSKPLVIDLVPPEVTPPNVPTVHSRPAQPIGRVGLLAAGRWRRGVKRAIDIIGSLSMLLILSPLMLAVAIAIDVTSPGHVIFVQRRIGKDGRPFRMWKFRSMVDGAEAIRDRHAHQNRHTHGPVFKIPDDPRVTQVGRVIRRLSIDELPQLVNVLRGDMSLVGPRPALPEEFALCDEHVRQRTLVKPGLTCIWQVSGRSDVDFLRWVDMDLEYIQTWSLRLDLKLLLLTIPAVVRGQGAY
jgi:lipopolysaccharide/colanic/teichoic acid biosynthesis glycosyltransferase